MEIPWKITENHRNTRNPAQRALCRSQDTILRWHVPYACDGHEGDHVNKTETRKRTEPPTSALHIPLNFVKEQCRVGQSLKTGRRR